MSVLAGAGLRGLTIAGLALSPSRSTAALLVANTPDAPAAGPVMSADLYIGIADV